MLRIVVTDGAPASITRVLRGSFPQSVTGLEAGSYYLLNSASSPTPWTVSNGATEPDAFGDGDWTARTGTAAGQIVIDITALGGDGGSAITAIEYAIDGGTRQVLSGLGTGPRTLTMPDEGVQYQVALYKRNARGLSVPSIKTVRSFATTVFLSGSIPSLAMKQGDPDRVISYDSFVSNATLYQPQISAPAGITFTNRGLTASASALRAGVSIPIKAFGPNNSEITFTLAYAVDAVASGSDNLIAQGDRSIVAQPGATVQILEPYDQAGTVVVPSTTTATRQPSMVGYLRSGGKFSFRRAFWWYDDNLGSPSFAFQLLRNNANIAGAPTGDPGTETWLADVTDAMIGSNLKVRETMTLGGQAFTAETPVQAVSTLPAFKNRDLFSHPSNFVTQPTYTGSSGLIYQRIGNLGGVSGIKTEGDTLMYSSTSAGNARLYRRSTNDAANYYYGGVMAISRAEGNTKTAETHGLWPAVKMPRNPTDTISNALWGITCVYRKDADDFQVLKFNGSNTPIVLATVPNVGLDFNPNPDDPEETPVVDICLIVTGTQVKTYVNSVLISTITETELTGTDSGWIVRGTNKFVRAQMFYGAAQ